LRRLGLAWNDLDSDAVGVMLGDNRFAQLHELNVAGRLGDDDKKRLKAHFGDRVRA
jgi:hypothetical protein